MSRFLLALGILCLLASSADACGRCGRRGNHCRYYTPVYHAPKYVAPVYHPNVQNFVFNNSFPTPYLLSDQGNSVYGYSLAATAYQTDHALILDRASRLTEYAQETARGALEGALQLTDAADRRHQNTLLALSAIEANKQEASTLSFKATVTDGKLSVERLEPLALVEGLSCGRCHDGSGANGVPKEFVFDGSPVSLDHFSKATKAIMDGSMPPKNEWTLERRTQEVTNLARYLTK